MIASTATRRYQVVFRGDESPTAPSEIRLVWGAATSDEARAAAHCWLLGRGVEGMRVSFVVPWGGR